MSETLHTDVLIIGAGAAGLSVALRLAEQHDVTLIVKGSLPGGASYWAQGGISVAVGEDDSIASHIADTMQVGGVLCHPDTVRMCVENGREQLEWLMAQGVKFTQSGSTEDAAPADSNVGNLHLTREGGHSFRRVVHSDDATGAAIQKCLTANALKMPRLKILGHRIAVDLIKDQQGRCVGAYILNESTRQVEVFAAKAIVLATGGASRAYLYSTNPDVASGDGIAMGWRAGCRVANLEFNQFHPTCLYHPNSRTFLLTEALRGEGAVLRLPKNVGVTVGSNAGLNPGSSNDNALGGSRFMLNYHPLAELAPRDVVARSIDAEMKKHGLEHVLLDISHREPEFIKAHFPTIYAYCLELGLDLTKDPIPVVPAAHYTCGGLITDLHGATNVPGLYAVGEVACTGLHGANRMASNSLLECFVFGTAAARHIAQTIHQVTLPGQLKPWDDSQVMESDEAVVILHNWEELRRAMWNYMGIVRTSKRLERAAHRIALLKNEVHDYYSRSKVTRDLLELRNLVQVAELMVRSAQLRKESRGLHFMSDYPDTDPAQAHDTVLEPE